jgi:hypothetical protein
MQKWINLNLLVKMQLTTSGTQAPKDELEIFGYSQIHEKKTKLQLIGDYKASENRKERKTSINRAHIKASSFAMSSSQFNGDSHFMVLPIQLPTIRS